MVQKFQGRSGGGHSAAPRPRPAAWSPAYAAPGVNTPRSDLASLGYVLVEMLAGQSPFAGLTIYRELVDAKAVLDKRLPELLPPEAADVGRKGAADSHRQPNTMIFARLVPRI